MTEHTVKLWSALRPFAQGSDTVRIKARNIRELFARLEADYPGMAPLIAQGIAVSVDGTLYRDSWDTELPVGAEVFSVTTNSGWMIYLSKRRTPRRQEVSIMALTHTSGTGTSLGVFFLAEDQFVVCCTTYYCCIKRFV